MVVYSCYGIIWGQWNEFLVTFKGSICDILLSRKASYKYICTKNL